MSDMMTDRWLGFAVGVLGCFPVVVGLIAAKWRAQDCRAAAEADRDRYAEMLESVEAQRDVAHAQLWRLLEDPQAYAEWREAFNYAEITPTLYGFKQVDVARQRLARLEGNG